MKFLANENIPQASLNLIRNAGFDIISVYEGSPGISDPDVINLANAQGRTIITFDSDYGELIFKKGLFVEMGVIYLRFPTSNPSIAGNVVLSILKDQQLELQRALTVVDPEKIRQRRY